MCPAAGSTPAQIAPGIWVSGIAGLLHIPTLHITHVVSVVNGPPPTSPPSLETLPTRQRLHIDLEDDEDANLLQYLPAATDFIVTALSNEAKLLIHCAQGISRSVALAAAYLMQTSPELDVDRAIAHIRQCVPGATPNAGFVKQLELFHCMGCRLDPWYVPYKKFLAEQAAVRYHATGVVDASTFSKPQLSAAGGERRGKNNASGCSGGNGPLTATSYKCRKCRTLLATSNNVIETDRGPGQEGFAWRKRDKHSLNSHNNGGSAAANATSGGDLFVEPLQWMSSVAGGELQGKLYCPKCDARLGSFNWAGIQSSSGSWVTPAFHLHLSKLDVEEPFDADVAGMRRPCVLLSGGSTLTPQTTVQQTHSSNGEPTGADAKHRLLSTLQRQATFTDGTSNAARTDDNNTLVEAETPSTQTHRAFTHLILDCDGVMVDSERPSCEALRRAILQVTGFDIPHEFPIDFRPVFGMDVRSCVDYYQKRFSEHKAWQLQGDRDAAIDALADDISATKEGIYKALTLQGVQAFPGVAELVAEARALGMGVAVASSGSPEKIAHNLETSGLGHLVVADLRVSAKHVARGKPAPDVYLEALRRVGCKDASKAVVIEDAINGLRAARDAGCFTVAVATSLPVESLRGHADQVVEKLTDIRLSELKAV